MDCLVSRVVPDCLHLFRDNAYLSVCPRASDHGDCLLDDCRHNSGGHNADESPSPLQRLNLRVVSRRLHPWFHSHVC